MGGGDYRGMAIWWTMSFERGRGLTILVFRSEVQVHKYPGRKRGKGDGGNRNTLEARPEHPSVTL